MNFMIVSDIFCVFRPILLSFLTYQYEQSYYCVVMSNVKQESLANAKVRTYKHATAVHLWRPLAKKSAANQRKDSKEHNVDLKSTFSG